jgi:hypothetical protein
MAALMPQSGNVYSVSPEVQRQVVELYASIGSYAEVGRRLGISLETARRVIKSPQGSFALEQLLRERARTRALRLGASTDRLIDELDAILDRGDERILNGRRDGDPLTIFIRPGLRDVVSGLAWTTHHMREISETLSAIDVSNHDVSHESRSQNLATLKELVALEERRLAIDNERQAQDAPVVDAVKQTPWSRGSWGGNASTDPDRVTHRTHKDRSPHALAEQARLGALRSTVDGDTGDPGLSSSAPDASLGMSGADALADVMSSTSEGADSPVIAGGRQPQVEAPLMRQARDNTGEIRGSRDRPPTPRPPREAAPETHRDIRSLEDEVTWEDLE